MTKINISKIFFTDIEGFNKWYSLSVNVSENYIKAVKPNRRNKRRSLMIVIKLS